ncbi:FAD-linked oxidoreductase ZEB1 [Cladobotryum mycophilum]|uniref:FAD-linked oxidoreductase ZEB1 n=1 Tax=Cladobotryum mycophilum TaxID=491253 RepID=A0ABR0SY80_9HYPO
MSLTIFQASRPVSIHSQIAATNETASNSDSAPAGQNTLENLPIARWRGRRFIPERYLSRKSSRGRTSWIKNEGIFVQELLQDDKLGEVFWICRRCDEQYTLGLPFKASATTSATDHLRKKHRIIESDLTDLSTGSESEDPSLHPRKRQRFHTTPLSKTQLLKIHELLAGFIVDTDQPFSIFDNSYIRKVFLEFNPSLSSQISWSRTSQRQCVNTLFLSKKEIIKQGLHNALSQIHLGFDLWTSPNRLAIMAVTGHFLDQNGHQQQRLLALREQPGSHTVKDWGISTRLRTIVSDNASNNDTCLQHLFNILDPTMTSVKISERRMRCYGHILNLVARAYLYGENSESFEQESQKGPIGKLHNIVRFIRASPQRSAQFKKIVPEEHDHNDFLLHNASPREVELLLNNETRWNSTYLMIERAIEKQQQIQGFLGQNQLETDRKKRIPDEDILTIEDWRLLIEIKDILKPLWSQTMRCQGWGKGDSHGRIWEIMTGIEFLLTHLEHWKVLLGRSTGAGALSIWTHHLKNTEFLDWADAGYTGPALKVGAGVLGYEAVEAAAAHGLVVVTGECATVGVAGGYAQGGGHSALSTSFGLAADQALEYEVVTAAGDVVTASATKNADLYWALSGGGGGTYGVVTSLTVRAHPAGNIGGSRFSFGVGNGVTPQVFNDAVSRFHALLPSMIDQSAVVIYFLTSEALAIQSVTVLNSTGDFVRDTVLGPFIQVLNSLNVPITSSYTTLSYLDHYNVYMGPLPYGYLTVGGNQFGSRLIPRSLVENDNDSFQKVLANLTAHGVFVIGGAASYASRNGPPNAVLPAWRDALIQMQLLTSWNNTNWDQNLEDQRRITEEINPQLAVITPQSGAYMNEADFNEPEWKKTWFGTNYERLLSIKQRWDPDGMFYILKGVGSDAWTVGKDGRMCKT